VRSFAKKVGGEQPAVHVVLYSKPECHLCDVAKEDLQRLRAEVEFDLEVVDIRSDPELYETYKEQIPVVWINGRKAFKYHIEPERFVRLVKRAASRA
jgi:glutaredoxin